jgi:hypothetical protein
MARIPRRQGLSPQERAAWRAYAERLIDTALDRLNAAIAILDRLDGDADLEDDCDGEPSLGAPVGGDSQMCWSAGCDDEREMDRHPAAGATGG